MKVEGKTILIEYEEDYEFFKLIEYIIEKGFGEMKTLKFKNKKPYQIVECEKSILLTRDRSKDSRSYGG